MNRPSIDSCPEKIIIKNKYSHQYIFNKDGQLGIVFWSNRIPDLVYENINFKRDIVDQGFDPRTYKIDNEPVCIANKVFTIESFGDYAKCDSNLSCETYIKANVPQNWYINNEKMMTLENMKKQVIKDFYTLLSKGDITTAEDFLVFEKRNKGTFEINKMKAFYEHMKQPINLISVETAGEDTFNVSYKYTKNISECNGSALVETYQDKSNGAIYIQKISANC